MSAIFQEHHARPDRPPLVLLHGWGMSSDVWQAWLPELQPHFDLNLIDLPGLGRSETLAGPYTLKAVADRVAQAVDRPALWLGWSLGGLVAAAVAARHPQKVTGLMTVATNPCFVARPDWPPGMALETFAAFEAGLAEDVSATLNRFVMLQGQGDDQGRQVVRTLKAVLKREQDFSDQRLDEALKLLNVDYRAIFASLSLPRRFLFGEHDQLVPSSVAQAEPLVGQAQVIPGTGHAPFLSAPEVVKASLLELQQEVYPER